jgi:hypothetical protein
VNTARPTQQKSTWRRKLALAAAGALILPFGWRDTMAQGIDSVETTTQGTVRRMTTGPMGEVDGAVLDDGTTIHWPPHLSSRFTSIVTTGERVRAIGRIETGPDGDTHLEARKVTNLRTDAAIESEGPPPGPDPRRGLRPALRRGSRLEDDRAATGSRVVKGVVQRLTTAPMGEVDGAILEDGTVIHWPPHLAGRLAAVVVKGNQVEVRGWTETGPDGDTHFEVQTATNLGTNASVGTEPGGPRPPRLAPGSSRDFEANSAPAESVERRLKALEDQIVQLKDEIQKLRDEL